MNQEEIIQKLKQDTYKSSINGEPNMKEEWEDIKGYEGLYQVSNMGRVKTLAHVTICKNGIILPVKERILKSGKNARLLASRPL